MGVVLHWFLPTNGDSRTDLSLGNAVGAAGSRAAEGGTERAPDIGYIGQIARSAEQVGFTGALTPTSSWCEDAWIMTAGLTQVTERFKFLVAFRPGLMSPPLAAHMAATYQRISGGRLLLNVVTGGDDVEQQRFGDHLGKDDRYERAGEFLHIVRELWRGDPVTFQGRHYDVRAGQIIPARVWPDIYLGGSSAPALDVAARYADVYLTWGEPPESEGQRRMAALHGGRTDALEVSPNLWAGVGLVRGGAGTALVGSHDEVAERIAGYYALGVDEYILSGYPHLEEAYQVGEGLMPALRRRGLLVG
jgi:alkanesulfonate monooxygenase